MAGREAWYKLHIGRDADAGEIIATALTFVPFVLVTANHSTEFVASVPILLRYIPWLSQR